MILQIYEVVKRGRREDAKSGISRYRESAVALRPQFLIEDRKHQLTFVLHRGFLRADKTLGVHTELSPWTQ